MSKLEAKHVLPYALYGAKMLTEKNLLDKEDRIWTLQPSNFPNNWKTGFNSKIILRPMEDIKYYVDFLNKYYVDFDKKEGCLVKRKNENYTRLNDLDFLFQNHFDVFGLIEKGIAVDINTLSVQNDG